MDTDTILGGLESAFARGQSLQKSMISFYNAGYKKTDIEDAARKFQEIHQRRFAELGVEPEQKKKVMKTPVSDYSSKKPLGFQGSEPKLKIFKSEIVNQEADKSKQKKLGKKLGKTEQIVSKYGEDSLRESENFKEAIIEAISNIKKVPVYMENPEKFKPVIIQQKVQGGTEQQTPVSKAITFLLIFLLILLVGLLIAVFFFKEELIELFNNLSIK
jgi:hypothetical protein